MSKFFAQGRKVYQEGTETLHPDGTRSLGIHLPICEMTDWVKDPEKGAIWLADRLNKAEEAAL